MNKVYVGPDRANNEATRLCRWLVEAAPAVWDVRIIG